MHVLLSTNVLYYYFNVKIMQKTGESCLKADASRFTAKKFLSPEITRKLLQLLIFFLLTTKIYLRRNCQT